MAASGSGRPAAISRGTAASTASRSASGSWCPGRVLDEYGRPVRNTLVEIWQANAAGRYVHKVDQHDAPLDPNFLGAGRCVTDAEGRYRFLTIKPGAYPWRNHPNAWRPNHIHFSLFGAGFASRLVTQMYFPGDPLIAARPDLQQRAGRMRASAWSRASTSPRRSPNSRSASSSTSCSAGATRRRSKREAAPEPPAADAVADGRPVLRLRADGARTMAAISRRSPTDASPATTRRGRASGSSAVCSTAPATPVPDAMIEIWQADAAGRYAGARGLRRSRRLPRLRPDRHRRRPDATLRDRDDQARRATAARRRTSTSSSSCAACSSMPSRASISATRRRRTPPDPVLALVPARTARDAHRRARGRKASTLRHPYAGRERDRLLRRVREALMLYTDLSFRARRSAIPVHRGPMRLEASRIYLSRGSGSPLRSAGTTAWFDAMSVSPFDSILFGGLLSDGEIAPLSTMPSSFAGCCGSRRRWRGSRAGSA